MLPRLRGLKYFMSIDLCSRYYLIKLSPKTRHNNAFTIIFGTFPFLRMPFGPAQGPTYSMAVKQKVFIIFTDFCFFDIDDVLLHDSTEKNHLGNFEIIYYKVNFRDFMIPLNKFTKKNTPFGWIALCQVSFITIKSTLITVFYFFPTQIMKTYSLLLL